MAGRSDTSNVPLETQPERVCSDMNELLSLTSMGFGTLSFRYLPIWDRARSPGTSAALYSALQRFTLVTYTNTSPASNAGAGLQS